MQGWVKIHRQLKDKAYYKDSEFVHLWLHLLLCANHCNGEYLNGYEIIKLNKGQFITGRKKLSLETGISESKIERILKVFESEQQIEQQTNSRNRLISIVSWDKYQETEQQKNSKRTASGQQVNTNNNDNNEIILTKVNSVYGADFSNLVGQWLDYKKTRKESYKSEKSIMMFCEKLSKLSKGEISKTKEIIETSMANNWAGIFELKNNQPQTDKPKSRIEQMQELYNGAKQ